MAYQILQDSDTSKQIISQVVAWLAEHQLELSGAHQSNIDSLMGYMSQHFTDPSTGRIDASFVNYQRAISALKKTNSLVWAKTPTKKFDKPERENAADVLNAALRQAGKQISQADQEADAQAVLSAIGVIKRHSGYPHSRAEKEREALKGAYDAAMLQRALGKATGHDVLDAVQKLRDSF